MKSDLPKVLVPVLGRPMVRYVLDALREAGIRKRVVVIGYRGELVRQELSQEPGIVFVEQAEQRGTGHAVMVCREQIEEHVGPVLIVTGDSPMLQISSVSALLAEYDRKRPACLLGTANRDDPHGLGRILRDESGAFQGIVEEKDATPEQRTITEVNMSTYLFRSAALLKSLQALTNENAQSEYYLTDCPGILRSWGETVEAVPKLKASEALSINTLEDLLVVETELQKEKSTI